MPSQSISLMSDSNYDTLTGLVTRLAGALVDIGIENDALLHISQIKRGAVNKINDHLTKGQEIVVWVYSIDREHERISLTMIKPPAISWSELVEGHVHKGRKSWKV